MQRKRELDFAVAMSESLNGSISGHLLQHVTSSRLQEDVCFALWRPSKGAHRLTAILWDVVLPGPEDRILNGNVSFTEPYFRRVLTAALNSGCGIALLHSHIGPGWQNLSPDDHDSEASFAGRIQAATKNPLLGMTIGTDGSWSARLWQNHSHRFAPDWASTVRVVGQKLGVTFHPSIKPAPEIRARLKRTVGVWGRVGQANLARLRIGIVGLGSVGSIVAEELARMGIEEVVFIDFDVVEELNLDRVLNATQADIGRLKVEVACEAFKKHSNAKRARVHEVNASVVEEKGYSAALDCDVLFSCVDRHLPRRVLNHIAYAHCVPVIDGGILVRLRGQRVVGADWHVRTVAPGRACLECLGAYDPSIVGMEREGLLDDPSYLAQLDEDDSLLRHENVLPFSMSVASLEVLQLAKMVLGPVHNIGDQNYHFVTGTLDRLADMGCKPSCLFPPLVATGDSAVRPVGRDIAAEKAGRKRGKRT